MNVRIDVHREDGAVTRIEGNCGIALTATITGTDLAREADTPIVLLRGETGLQLAWLLGGLLGAIDSLPDGHLIREGAENFAKDMNFDDPLHKFIYPGPEGAK